MEFLPPQAPTPQPPAGAPATNGHAVASMVLGVLGLLGLVLTAGIASPLTLPLSIAAWVTGARGKRRVDRGEPVGDRHMAATGAVMGMVGVGLGILALVLWGVLIAVGVTDLHVQHGGDPGPQTQLDNIRTLIGA